MLMTASVLKYRMNLEESIVADMIISLNGLSFFIATNWSLLCKMAMRTSVLMLL